MTVSLAFRFLAGRYHATPFGHHVNEGLIEWPPSPWRLLRALLSIGYTSGIWDEAVPPDVVRLIEQLSSDLPCYYLPPAIGTHSRHYMPTGVAKKKTLNEETKLVFDTWAHVEDQDLIVIWRDVHLKGVQLSMLTDLVERLNYLGRSESWVEGRVVQGDETIPDPNCFPESQGEVPDRNWEQVAILAPENTDNYKTWRGTQLEEALDHLPLPTGKKPSKKLLKDRKKIEDTYPSDLLDCLQKDTTWLRSHGWSRPPGSRRVFYWRRSDAAISTTAPQTKAATRSGQRVKAMLLSLTNDSCNDHALPPVSRTLPQAELLHDALVRIGTKIAAERGLSGPPQELTGCDATGKALKGAHEHAHINPLDLDHDGHLDHILIWASSGLGIEAQAAIRAARRTPTKGGIELLRLAVAATGDFQDLPAGLGQQRISRLTEASPSWQSVTPFVVPRYVKVRGKNSLEGQIRAELGIRGLPNPTSVLVLAPRTLRQSNDAAGKEATGEQDEGIWSGFRHFKLARRHGRQRPQPPLACGFAIRLEFERPVPGPIAIGYGSHFGLGLFEGCKPTETRT